MDDALGRVGGLRRKVEAGRANGRSGTKPGVGRREGARRTERKRPARSMVGRVEDGGR